MENSEKKLQAEKTYSPKMIKEANKLIYDYFRRHNKERVKKYCKTRQTSHYHGVAGGFFVSFEFDYQKPVFPKETSFTDDLGADSMLMVDFIMSCVQEFGKTVPAEDAMRIKTVADFYDVFERYWFNK